MFLKSVLFCRDHIIVEILNYESRKTNLRFRTITWQIDQKRRLLRRSKKKLKFIMKATQLSKFNSRIIKFYNDENEANDPLTPGQEFQLEILSGEISFESALDDDSVLNH